MHVTLQNYVLMSLAFQGIDIILSVKNTMSSSLDQYTNPVNNSSMCCNVSHKAI